MAEVIRLKPIRPCPICGKPSTQAHSPFCSGRCQDIDLNRWLSDKYVIADTSKPDEDDAVSNSESGDEDEDS